MLILLIKCISSALKDDYGIFLITFNVINSVFSIIKLFLNYWIKSSFDNELLSLCQSILGGVLNL